MLANSRLGIYWNLKLKNSMTLPSTIEFVLMRKVHDESNLTCISKAFDPTAFGPRQISVFISLCVEFNGKYQITIF